MVLPRRRCDKAWSLSFHTSLKIIPNSRMNLSNLDLAVILEPCVLVPEKGIDYKYLSTAITKSKFSRVLTK